MALLEKLVGPFYFVYISSTRFYTRYNSYTFGYYCTNFTLDTLDTVANTLH